MRKISLIIFLFAIALSATAQVTLLESVTLPRGITYTQITPQQSNLLGHPRIALCAFPMFSSSWFDTNFYVDFGNLSIAEISNDHSFVANSTTPGFAQIANVLSGGGDIAIAVFAYYDPSFFNPLFNLNFQTNTRNRPAQLTAEPLFGQTISSIAFTIEDFQVTYPVQPPPWITGYPAGATFVTYTGNVHLDIFAGSPVPEPSTYSIIGVAGLVCLVLIRNRSARL